MPDPMRPVSTATGSVLFDELTRWHEPYDGYGHTIRPRLQSNVHHDDDFKVSIVTDPHSQSVFREGAALRDVYQRRLSQIMTRVSPERISPFELGGDSYVYFADDLAGYGVRPRFGGGVVNHPGRIGSWGRSQPDALRLSGWDSRQLFTTYTAMSMQWHLARNQTKDLQQTVDTLVDKVRVLERLVSESHQMILAFSQSYYWTSEWQAKENRADEDDRLGRSRQYSSVEELIADLNG